MNKQEVIDIALAEVGYLEKASNSNLDHRTANAGRNNWTKYARDLDLIPGFYNGKKNGYAWCDVFVDWCFVKAYGVASAKDLLCQPNNSAGAGCTASAQYYKNKGQFHTSKPQPGDQIFFGSGSSCTHTGLVYKVDSSKVYTVEGNTSGASGVVPNGGGVCKKSYSLTYSKIVGYGRPKYNSTKEEAKDEKPVVLKPDPAKSFAAKYAKTYSVTASALNMRTGASTKKAVIKVLKKGEKFRCYGYYTNTNGTLWLYGVDNEGTTGFCSSEYLL